MSISATAVQAAIETTIAGVTPSTTTGQNKFVLDATASAPISERSMPTGMERHFEVDFAGGELGQIHHPAEEESVEQMRVTVVYPATGDLNKLSKQIRADVADVKKALNNPAHWAGGVLHQVVLRWPEAVVDVKAGRVVQTIIVSVRFLEAT